MHSGQGGGGAHIALSRTRKQGGLCLVFLLALSHSPNVSHDQATSSPAESDT